MQNETKFDIVTQPPLRDILDAPKDRTVIWAVIRIPKEELEARPNLEQWDGVQVPLRHPGVMEGGFDTGWSVAAPVGHGGFPDEWILGWVPVLTVPERGSQDD
ncbi:hypothetical protein [Roseibium sp. RKSG952]|uniref:hypothetical protein n=1 Tax=Roseibium sp. RKSG952 TaxID=2529384 RepID=UPI0012BC4E32|nr:hypothetical protein [Roseibium sp. RKSG952]MTH95918.1 hypothetical protein [Roseibium sp. RKSG952]